VFSASWQSGWGIRAGLIFYSFCIKAKGKENIFFLYFSLMKSTKNPARTVVDHGTKKMFKLISTRKITFGEKSSHGSKSCKE